MSKIIKVLLVDDSAFIRYTLTKHLETDPSINIVGTASNGLKALEQIALLQPDVVILDVEMPDMDGLTALKQIMMEHPTPVIMFSALTKQGARTTIQALMRGALDFVAKPDANTDMGLVVEALKEKIKMVVGIRPVNLPGEEFIPTITPNGSGLQPFQMGDFVIVIGSSTGGPRALQKVLVGLPANLPAAILIVQHMPQGFTQSLATRLNKISPLFVQQASENDRLARGQALLSPGDVHLSLKSPRQVTLSKSPRRNHVRPSVDVTMEAVVKYHKAKVIGVILTGMGQDGTAGASLIKSAGGHIIAQDKESSVVYGMPASVAKAGLVDQVLPLSKVAGALVKLVRA